MTDSEGNEVGSTNVSDAASLGEYGEHVAFRAIGDYNGDGDHGIVDSIRYGNGTVVEGFENRSLNEYRLTRDGGGDFDVVSGPTSAGSSALRAHTGARTTQYTSEGELMAIEPGTTIEGEIRHETDNSGSYAMRTGFVIGANAAGDGGVRVDLANPGSYRNEGARILTPNNESRIDFTPERGEFYTFEIAIGGGSVNGTVVTDDSDPSRVAGATVTVETENGRQVAETETDADGFWRASAPPGEYIIGAEFGNVETETKSTTAIERGESTTKTLVLDLCANSGELYAFPDEPTTADRVAFSNVCTDLENSTWRFDDGTTDRGSTVLHRFEEPGSYDVTVSDGNETIEKTIDVERAPIVITDVTDGLAGRTIDRIDVENPYRVEIDANESIDSVIFEVDGEVYDGVELEDGVWGASIDVSELRTDDTVTITATDEAGRTHTVERSIVVQPTPEWLVRLLAIAELTESAPAPSLDGGLFENGVYYEPVSLNFSVNQQVDQLSRIAPWDRDVGVDYGLGFSLGFHMPSGHLEAGGSLDLEKELTGITAEGGGDVDVVFANEENALQEASGSVYLGGGRTIRIGPTLPAVGTVSLDLSAGVTGHVENEFGPGLSFDRTRFGPTATYSVGQELTVKGVGVSAEVGGETDGRASFQLEDPLFESLDLGTSITGTAELDAVFYSTSSEIEIVEGTITIGNARSSAERAAIYTDESDEWTERSVRGEQPASDDAAVSALADTTSTTSHDRLTNRPYDDTEAAIAETVDGRAVVWSRQDENRSIEEGRDLRVRHFDDETGWGDPVAITNDSRHDEMPSIAARDDSDELVATWSRLPIDATGENVTEPDDAYPQMEVAMAHYDGEEWSEQELVTENDALDHEPTIASTEDQWLVAWDHNPTNDHTDYENRSVEYVLLDDDGTPIADGAIANASMAAVGTNDSGGFDLAYYESEGTGTDNGTIVRGAVDVDGTYAERARHDVETYGDHAVDGGELLWTDGPTSEPRLLYEDGVTVEELAIDGEMSGIEELTLDVEGDDSLVTYRGRPGTQQSRDLIYRLSRDGEWVTDKRVAGGADLNLTLWHSDAALGDDGFSLAYTAKPFGLDKRGDLVVTQHDFHPDYAIEAETLSSAAAGETATVGYTVQNVGDVAGNESVPVVVSDGADELVTDRVGPLAPNETESAAVNVTAPTDGTIEVTVAPETADETRATEGGASLESRLAPEGDEWLSASETLRTGYPELSVAGIETSTINETAANVSITVANDGKAAATEVPVQVQDGFAPVANETIPELRSNVTTTVTTTVNRSAFNRSISERIVIDPAGTLDDGALHSQGKSRTAWLFRPELSVSGPVTYEEGDDGPVANVLVSNRESIAANTTIEATTARNTAENESRLGEVTVSIPAAPENGSATETVSVPIPEATEGQAVQFTAGTDVPIADYGAATVIDTVGPVWEPTTKVEIAVENGVTGEPVVDEFVWIDDRNAKTDANGTAEIRPAKGDKTLEIDADGYDAYEETITVDGDDSIAIELTPDGSRTVTGSVTTGDGTPVENAVVDVDGAAQTAVTDANGTYSLALLPGTYTLEVTADGYEPLTKSIEVSDDSETNHRVTLERATGTVGGTIVDGAGDPIENATVELDGDDEPRTTTDAAGAYNLTAVTGNHTLIADADGYESTTESIEVTADERTTRNLTLEAVERTGTIDGTVEDENGDPIEGVTVTIEETDHRTTTDENGSFTFDLPAGEYTLEFDHQGITTTRTVTVAAGETTTVTVAPDDEMSGFGTVAALVALLGVLYARTRTRQ